MSDPINFLLIVGIVAGAVWWLRSYIGKERIAALEERLRLAADKQTVVTEKIDEVKEQVSLISQQIQGHTILVPSLLVETEKLSGTIGDLSLANTEVSGTLSASGALYKSPFSEIFKRAKKD